ncbi:MAG: DivIVA domain-containing protein [Acidimicrobiia bacterium]
MANQDSSRLIASGGRMLPEEVANRSFRSALRGISESDVRTFLRRVADEMARIRADESALRERIADLEARSNAPVSLTEQQLLDALGEETAKVLRSAQDAADEIRTKAEARAALVRREAQDEARRVREEADQTVGARLAESQAEANTIRETADARAMAMIADAESRVSGIRTEAEREAELIRERAARASEAHLEDARTSGRELVAEARAVRERIITDLVTRRTLLQEQIEELRKGREALLGAYKVVKETLDAATEALREVEVRAASELMSETPDAAMAELASISEGPDRAVFYDQDAAIAAEDALEIALAEVMAAIPSTTDSGAVIELETVVVVEQSVAIESEMAATQIADLAPMVATAPDEKLLMADEEPPVAVDALFAKLRAARADAVGEARQVLDTAVETSVTETEIAIDEVVAQEVASLAAGAMTVTPQSTSEDDAVRDAQVQAIDAAAPAVIRKAKRILQDEQNELLDALRTAKRTPASETMLPDRASRMVVWSAALESGVAGVFAAGWESIDRAGTVPERAPAALVEEAVEAILAPWRDRLADAIDQSTDGDAVTRVGARFREFRAQQLDTAIREVLALAYARGVYDAAPNDAILRWIPSEVGHCPDCDDNALEPVRKGTPFPTGQVFPPAHPGCRCMLAVSVVGATLQ